MNTVHNCPASAHENSLGAAPHPACGHMDSLAPTRSAPKGPPPPANSFHNYPSCGSLPRAEKDRLPVQVVEHLHRLLGGDARVETMVLRFIADKYGAKNLCHLPPPVASAIIKRPADFLRAVKDYGEPQLKF